MCHCLTDSEEDTKDPNEFRDIFGFIYLQSQQLVRPVTSMESALPRRGRRGGARGRRTGLVNSISLVSRIA